MVLNLINQQSKILEVGDEGVLLEACCKIFF
jgi:hypothetical protein